MPDDPNIYMDFIKNRMTKKQAEELRTKMDIMEKTRFSMGLSLLSLPIITMIVLFIIASFKN